MSLPAAGFYRRKLPQPPAVEFASPAGKEIFKEALAVGGMEGFFHLVETFQTQDEPSFCGLASLANVLNALAIDPGRKWKGPWRWFHERMLDCCEPLDKVENDGIVLSKVACLGRCNGAIVEDHLASDTTEADFRKHVEEACSREDLSMIVAYSRKTFLQTGDGHFSPIAGYHKQKDLVLILDVARFKYPPHWVPLSMLWESMLRIDPTSEKTRGYMLLRSSQNLKRPVLFTLVCWDPNWKRIIQYLSVDLPCTLASESFSSVNDIVKVAAQSLPAQASAIVTTYSAMQPSEEDPTAMQLEHTAAKAAVRQQLHLTRPYTLVRRALRQSPPHSCCENNGVPVDTPVDETASSEGTNAELLTMLLLACPPETWQQLPNEELRADMLHLMDPQTLPAGVQNEAEHLRQQLRDLSGCEGNAATCSQCSTLAAPALT
eukprot:jgi/Chlat1/2165/Chrsp17S02739